MLTIKDIIYSYSEGVDIEFIKKPPVNHRKGDYCPSELKAIIYKESITSEKDMHITILHEFVHARNNENPEIQLEEEESKVEKEAKDTYNKRPYIIEFIYQIYKIKKEVISS